MSRKMSKRDKTRKRRQFTAEYKAEVVQLCRRPGNSPYKVARDLGLAPSCVTRWVRQAEADAAGRGSGPLTTAEREELAAPRRENRALRKERDILRKATALFAREGMW